VLQVLELALVPGLVLVPVQGPALVWHRRQR